MPSMSIPALHPFRQKWRRPCSKSVNSNPTKNQKLGLTSQINKDYMQRLQATGMNHDDLMSHQKAINQET